MCPTMIIYCLGCDLFAKHLCLFIWGLDKDSVKQKTCRTSLYTVPLIQQKKTRSNDVSALRRRASLFSNTVSQIEKVKSPGLGAAFFSVQNVPFFSILFLSFLRLMEPKRAQETQRKRTQCSFAKNAKNAMFFCKERKQTGERFVLMQKNAERSVLISIYIYIYRYIYINIYFKKNFKLFFNLIKRMLCSFMFFICKICNFCMTYETKKNAGFFCVLL